MHSLSKTVATNRHRMQMFSTIATYIRQRFNLLIFLPLAVFLLIYAAGTDWDIRLSVMVPYTLLLLLWFRLFDDLASRTIDSDLTERIYTHPDAHRQLRQFLLPLAVALIALSCLYSVSAALLLGIFMLVNLMMYTLLFARWKWRFILPLVKYPVLSFLLADITGSPAGFTMAQYAGALALLPAFILFEWLDDRSFHLSTPIVVLLFALLHLLVFNRTGSDYAGIIVSAAITLPAVLLSYRTRFRGAGYLLLLYVLALRLFL